MADQKAGGDISQTAGGNIHHGDKITAGNNVIIHHHYGSEPKQQTSSKVPVDSPKNQPASSVPLKATEYSTTKGADKSPGLKTNGGTPYVQTETGEKYSYQGSGTTDWLNRK